MRAVAPKYVGETIIAAIAPGVASRAASSASGARSARRRGPGRSRARRRRAGARTTRSRRCRGMDVPLDHDRPAVGRPLLRLADGVRERQADRVVAARCAVQQEPAALGPPSLGREPLRALEGRRLGADVDPFDPAGDVVKDRRVAQDPRSSGSVPIPLCPGMCRRGDLARRRPREHRDRELLADRPAFGESKTGTSSTAVAGESLIRR